jgi:ferredoxin, 2Fe-2S
LCRPNASGVMVIPKDGQSIARCPGTWSGTTVRGQGVLSKVIYIDSAGREYAVDATVGETVMATAVKNGVPGIVAECGGNCSCATCHVWVAEEFAPEVGPPGDMEEDLLDMGVSERRSTSRLSCQIRVTEALDGLTVEIPPEQP